MADQSQYLVQALRSMQQDPFAQPAPQGPDLAAMQKYAQTRAAWEAANPGQNYMQHGLAQLGQNILGAPGAIMAAPGNAMSSLSGLLKPSAAAP